MVEDDELVRLGTVDMVRQLGHDVAEAGTGYDAMELLRQRPEIDVLITDLGLPGMSGQELVAAAHKLRPELPILLATGYTAADLARDPDSGAPFVLLGKPFSSADLQNALTIIDGKHRRLVGSRHRPEMGAGPRTPRRACYRMGSALALELEIFRRALAVLAANQLVADALAVTQAIQPGALDGRNVHEGVGAAIVGLDEAIALGGVEPFNGTGGLQGRPRSA